MSKKLPYWADQYLQHMREYRRKTYAGLQAAGTLEETALEVQSVANDFYQSQKAAYQAQGYSTTEAEIYADGATKREYICLPAEEDDDDLDLFDDDFDDDPP